MFAFCFVVCLPLCSQQGSTPNFSSKSATAQGQQDNMETTKQQPLNWTEAETGFIPLGPHVVRQLLVTILWSYIMCFLFFALHLDTVSHGIDCTSDIYECHTWPICKDALVTFLFEWYFHNGKQTRFRWVSCFLETISTQKSFNMLHNGDGILFQISSIPKISRWMMKWRRRLMRMDSSSSGKKSQLSPGTQSAEADWICCPCLSLVSALQTASLSETASRPFHLVILWGQSVPLLHVAKCGFPANHANHATGWDDPPAERKPSDPDTGVLQGAGGCPSICYQFTQI